MQQIYSKSTAFCHQRICLQHLDMSRCCSLADKSVVSPASRQQILSMWFRTDKSTASLQHLQLSTNQNRVNCREVMISDVMTCVLCYVLTWLRTMNLICYLPLKMFQVLTYQRLYFEQQLINCFRLYSNIIMKLFAVIMQLHNLHKTILSTRFCR
jgi:hypothetical protein